MPVPPPLDSPRLLDWFAHAFKANWRAAVVLFFFGLSIVGGYYLLEPVADALNVVAAWKVKHGYLYSAVSAALLVGVVPLLIEQFKPAGDREPLTWATLLAFAAFWAFKGVEVDALYRLLAFLFGDSNAPSVVVKKVLSDSGVYVPLWAVPTMVIYYRWVEFDFSFRQVWGELDGSWFRKQWLPILVTDWIIWIPTVTLIYILPLPLQLPMQNLVACFFVLLVIFITRNAGNHSPAENVEQTSN